MEAHMCMGRVAVVTIAATAKSKERYRFTSNTNREMKRFKIRNSDSLCGMYVQYVQ